MLEHVLLAILVAAQVPNLAWWLRRWLRREDWAGNYKHPRLVRRWSRVYCRWNLAAKRLRRWWVLTVNQDGRRLRREAERHLAARAKAARYG